MLVLLYSRGKIVIIESLVREVLKNDEFHMTHSEKVKVLESYLNRKPENYRDSYKTDIFLFFNENFTDENPLFDFLESFNEQSEIEDWVDFVTSQIVMKFDEEMETIENFIGEFLEVK